MKGKTNVGAFNQDLSNVCEGSGGSLVSRPSSPSSNIWEAEKKEETQRERRPGNEATMGGGGGALALLT